MTDVQSQFPHPIRDEDKTPALFRWGGLIAGIVLLSDGLRRFLLPAVRRDLSSFILYVVLGMICLSVAGYRRAFILDKRGLIQETSLLGRKVYRLLLPWSDLTRISWETQDDGMETVRLTSTSVRWLLRVPIEQKKNFFAWVESERPDLRVEDLNSDDRSS